MNSTHSIWLNLLFIALGILFFLLEKMFPSREVSHKKEWIKDVTAFLLLSSTGLWISNPLITFYRSLDLVWLNSLHTLPSLVKIVAATIVTDFLNYWIHYFMHKNPLYWRTHIYHHRVLELYWFSGLRASLGHYASFIFSRITVGIFLFNLNSLDLFFYLSFGLITNFYQHTNARLDSRLVELLFVTPRIHRLHHSIHGKRLKNIGTIFSFWDRLFGTYESPDNFSTQYELGVKGEQKSIYKEFIGI
jgi:sterol desaturase/sphingolipid hydroxylase (fatty acid hydroxylase superfamily)